MKLTHTHEVITGPIRHYLKPSNVECRWMVDRLVKRFGVSGAAAVMGCSQLSVVDWTTGRQGMSLLARRVVWLHYVLLCSPDSIQTVFDLATWGRFVRVPASEMDKDGD